jgi:pimeloyl-ACP methyl ester carboxylesterase
LATGISLNYPLFTLKHVQIFFFPYFGGGPSEYNEVLMQLDEFECVAFSNAGLGCEGDSYSVRAAINDMGRLIASHLNEDDEYLLVGHSMTGKMALGVAASQPSRLKGLVLLAPSPPTPETIPDMVRERMLTAHGTREAAIETLRSNWHREMTGDYLEHAILADLETQDHDWKHWLQTGSREDISELLAHVQVPTLVVTGDKDAGMTPEMLNREIVSKVPGARLEVVPDAGHFLPIEAPDEVAELIREFTRTL